MRAGFTYELDRLQLRAPHYTGPQRGGPTVNNNNNNNKLHRNKK
jgi:hypothetical protein